MNNSRTSGFWDFLSKYIEEVNLSNSFLILGTVLIFIVFYCKICECNTQDSEIFYLGLKIGFITLFFGGIFRLLNIIMRPLRKLKNFDEMLKDLLIKIEKFYKNEKENRLPSRVIAAKKMLDLESDKEFLKTLDKIDLSQKIFRWNDFLRFSVWISFLLFYILIISELIDLFPNFQIIFLLFVIAITVILFSISSILRSSQVKK